MMNVLTDNISQERLEAFLVANLSEFGDSFWELVTKHNYSKKLYDFSKKYYVLDGENIASLICAYFNKEEAKCYIPYVCTNRAYCQKGLASKILDVIIEESKDSGIQSVALEVVKSNLPALSLYKSKGFTIESANDSKYLMVLRF